MRETMSTIWGLRASGWWKPTQHLLAIALLLTACAPESPRPPTTSPSAPADGGVVAIQVVDTDGRPLPGAQVHLDGRIIGTTNRDGEAAASGVTPGRHNVLVEHPRGAPNARPVYVPPGAGASAPPPVIVRVPASLQPGTPPPSFKITGRVTLPDGSPASGAEVRLDGLPNRVETTARDGSYTFEAVSLGSHFVVARSPQGESEPVDVEILRGDATARDLVIRPAPGASPIPGQPGPSPSPPRSPSPTTPGAPAKPVTVPPPGPSPSPGRR